MKLSPKATKVRSHLTIAECKQYDIVKRAILASIRLAAKAYLERFRSVARSGIKRYRLFLNRLKELQDYYLESKQIESLVSLKKLCFIGTICGFPETRNEKFVEERTPANAEEAAGYADFANEIGSKNRKGYTSRHKYSEGRENNVQKGTTATLDKANGEKKRNAEVKSAGRAEGHMRQQIVLNKTVMEFQETSKLKFV